jgi:hypothetical protein
VNDTPDYLHRQLDAVHRRIDWHLDHKNHAGFVIACQHRMQLLARLARLEASAGEQVPA